MRDSPAPGVPAVAVPSASELPGGVVQSGDTAAGDGGSPGLPPPRALSRRGRRVPLLFLNVLIISACGLVYELLAGSIASYLLGDSITQFSLVIGIYLSAMGLGAYLSRYLDNELGARFVEVQLAIGLCGGTAAPLLFLSFSRSHAFRGVLFFEVIVVGILVGLELPLLMRILERELELKELVARVLAFDYIGALVASLLFPIVFVPHLGLVRTSLTVGLVNVAVGAWAIDLLGDKLSERRKAGLYARAVITALVLVTGLIKADTLSTLAEESLFAERIVYAKTTPYQRIVVTSGSVTEHPFGRGATDGATAADAADAQPTTTRDFALYLNGNLQLASQDEYRYHETLVHPAMAAAAVRARVLVLGGGDGLAVREILKDPAVQSVTLVDLDPGMTSLARDFPPLGELNHHAFDDTRVHVVNADAFVWLDEQAQAVGPRAAFDVAIVDFPDPNHFALGKLYTRRFYGLLLRALAPGGAVAVQATSPLAVRKTFWTVVTTMEAAGFACAPYHTTVPSFGEWGFVLAKAQPFSPPTALRTAGLRFLDDAATLAALFVFPADMKRVPTGVNRLDNQLLVHTYEDEQAPYLRY